MITRRHMFSYWLVTISLLFTLATAATAGDMAPFEELLSAVTDPFTERDGLERFSEPAPDNFQRGFKTFCGT